jgi:hypothetical protein
MYEIGFPVGVCEGEATGWDDETYIGTRSGPSSPSSTITSVPPEIGRIVSSTSIKPPTPIPRTIYPRCALIVWPALTVRKTCAVDEPSIIGGVMGSGYREGRKLLVVNACVKFKLVEGLKVVNGGYGRDGEFEEDNCFEDGKTLLVDTCVEFKLVEGL